MKKYATMCNRADKAHVAEKINWEEVVEDNRAAGDFDLEDLEDGEVEEDFDLEEEILLPEGGQKEVQLSGADQECYELLNQLKVREQADAVGWSELEKDDTGLATLSEQEAQRLGSHKDPKAVPSAILEKEIWEQVLAEDNVDGSKTSTDAAQSANSQKYKFAKSRLVTLSSVWKRLRLGDCEFKSIDPVLSTLWHSLCQLRTACDSQTLPRPEKFRVQTRKLHWFNLAERQASCVRAVVGLPSKRTSRAYAWRNMAASFKQSCEWTEGQEVEMATGHVVLYVPPYSEQIKVGMVLTVWRYTALKGKRWGAKPCTMAVSKDVARYARISEMRPVPQELEGWYRCNAESLTAVCDMSRVVLVLKQTDVKRTICQIQVRLCEKSFQAVQEAKTWSADEIPKAQAFKASKGKQDKQVKRKADAMEDPAPPPGEAAAPDASDAKEAAAPEAAAKPDSLKALKSLVDKKKPEAKKLAEIPATWIDFCVLRSV